MTGPWLRIQASIRADPEVAELGFWGGIVWEAILEMTKLHDWRGLIEHRHLSGESIARHLNTYVPNGHPDEVGLIVQRLAEGLDTVLRSDLLEEDGAKLKIRNWSKYQRDTTNAERQKRYRERRRE